VVPIPGASALLAALVTSGLPSDRFTFYGFLPRTGRERREALDDWWSHVTLLWSTNRQHDWSTRSAIWRKGGAGTRQTVVARELTKQFRRGRAGNAERALRAYYRGTPPKRRSCARDRRCSSRHCQR
jgi:16S rRNA (cytidine1402-2'-O)-methyltransferase